MSRWFNAGPCQADKHYMLSPTSRLPDLSLLIEQESYFVVHAPRQTGKTTAYRSRRLCSGMVSVEVGSAFNNDPSAAELAILGTWYLLIFDRRKNALPIEERLSTKILTTENQRAITVIRARI